MGTIVKRAVLLLCLTLALAAPMQAAQPPHVNRAPMTLEGLLSRFMGQVADLLKARGGFDPDGATTPPPPPPPTDDARGGFDPNG